ncbi:Metallo-dependent hydrolase [Suillus spraguei]|nr:Metallo-dependent hydrolase [Suillus spraguei]
MAATTSNDLICFTNCFLPQEDGGLIEKDLWIDERRGVILDAQRTFFLRKERPDTIIDLGGNILSPGFIDTQINGGFGFDFSVYDGDDKTYRDGLKLVAERIIETGVTAKTFYPKLLNLLRPWSPPNAAHLLGWHVEGPFLQMSKRGAHEPTLIIPALEGFKTFESIYGPENLAEAEDWLMSGDTVHNTVGVRMITAAPEVEGVMEAINEASKRGVCFNIGHSMATTDIATAAIKSGARCITHLFNAMPQLHHRDPSIIGLLGASPYLSSSSFLPFPSAIISALNVSLSSRPITKEPLIDRISEALDEIKTPPQTPMLLVEQAYRKSLLPTGKSIASPGSAAITASESEPKKDLTPIPFDRPFYGIIVDGIHSHPNSVRLAYSAHPDGCILITDAMKILDPHLKDGIHDWRDGRRLYKEGDKLYVEGTTTLAGSVVTLDKCVRNFVSNIENKKGTLRAGADADLAVLDHQGNVLSTWVKGKMVWARK